MEIGGPSMKQQAKGTPDTKIIRCLLFSGPNPPPHEVSRFSSCHPYNHFILGNLSIKWIIKTMQKEDLYAGK